MSDYVDRLENRLSDKAWAMGYAEGRLLNAESALADPDPESLKASASVALWHVRGALAALRGALVERAEASVKKLEEAA